jgi:hypothetical protein
MNFFRAIIAMGCDLLVEWILNPRGGTLWMDDKPKNAPLEAWGGPYDGRQFEPQANATEFGERLRAAHPDGGYHYGKVRGRTVLLWQVTARRPA